LEGLFGKTLIIQGFQNFCTKKVTMPIYAYRCQACGYACDVLQKMSDAPLTDCESCGKPELKKQLTAAGFQLKGTGWYVTDFRDGSGGGKPKSDTPESVPAASSEGSSSATQAASTTAAAPAAASTDTKPSTPAAT
jgi:putative FmdB family regulatory protein